MSGLARKSTHAKGGKKRRAAIENVDTHLKDPVGVVGEPSEVTFGPKNRSMGDQSTMVPSMKDLIIF